MTNLDVDAYTEEANVQSQESYSHLVLMKTSRDRKTTTLPQRPLQQLITFTVENGHVIFYFKLLWLKLPALNLAPPLLVTIKSLLPLKVLYQPEMLFSMILYCILLYMVRPTLSKRKTLSRNATSEIHRSNTWWKGTCCDVSSGSWKTHSILQRGELSSSNTASGHQHLQNLHFRYLS